MIAAESVTEGYTFLVAPDEEEASRQAASIVADQINSRPDSLLCVAAGNTPTRTYALLGEMAAQGQFPTDRLTILKLDEWLDLPLADPHTCERYIRQHLLEPLAIPDDRYIAFDSRPANARDECRRVATEIARTGGIDLAILGVGVNGHLGLNEPGTVAQPCCHVAALAPTTAEHTLLRGVAQDIHRGVTLGIGDILQARSVLLLAYGRQKSEAVRRLLKEEISPRMPASFLRLHPRVTCICDREAAGQLTPDEK